MNTINTQWIPLIHLLILFICQKTCNKNGNQDRINKIDRNRILLILLILSRSLMRDEYQGAVVGSGVPYAPAPTSS
jgi:hypothetical protein